jgi:hypothetical protein
MRCQLGAHDIGGNWVGALGVGCPCSGRSARSTVSRVAGPLLPILHSRRGRLYRCDLTDGARRATVAFLRLSLSYAVSVGSARLTAPAAGV